MRLSDTEDLADFIAENYKNAEKIVEIGVGAYPWVAKRLKERLPNARVVVTDTDEEKLAYAKKVCPELEPVLDDILNPQVKVYEGADLIYSIRPPPELISEILKLVLKIGCGLLIRPYPGEEGGYDYPKRHGWRLVSHGRATFYWLKRIFMR